MIDFKTIKQLDQVQYDLNRQLKEASFLADKYGLYDAGSFIRDILNNNESNEKFYQEVLKNELIEISKEELKNIKENHDSFTLTEEEIDILDTPFKGDDC